MNFDKLRRAARTPTSWMLAFAGLISLLALAYACRSWSLLFVSPRYIAFYFVLPGLLLAASVIATFLGREMRTIVAATLSVILLVLYAAEVTFRLSPMQRKKDEARASAAARIAGGQFDGRTMGEIVRDLRANGEAAYPLFAANEELRARLPMPSDGRRIFPLGGIPSVTNVYCNEGGGWLIYSSDRYGFNNPDDIWSKGGVDLAIVGNSWALGGCLPSGRPLVDRIRVRVPSLVNVSAGGTGPLTRLGQIKEYLSLVRPRVVLWLGTVPDFHIPLEFEKTVPSLRDYVDGKTQNLPQMAQQIGAAARAYYDGVIPTLDTAATTAKPAGGGLASSLRLIELRNRLSLNSCPPRTIDTAFASTVLRRAREEVESWGGKLIFVFLPVWADCELIDPARKEPTWLDTKVFEAARSAGVSVFDLRPALHATGDPKALFFFRGSHFNDKGAVVAADALLAAPEVAALRAADRAPNSKVR